MQLGYQNAELSRWGATLMWTAWLCVSLFVIFKTTTQTNYAVLSQDIAGTFGLNLSRVGILGSVYIAGFALMTIPSGALLDHYGARRLLTLGVLLVVAGAALFGSAQSWTVLCTGQFVMGVGGAFGYPALGYVTRHYFGARRFALLMGLASTMGALFAAVSQGGVAALLTAYDWREITLGLAGMGAVLALLIYLVTDDDVGREARRGAASPERRFLPAFWRDLKGIMAMPRMWGCAAVSGVVFSAYLGIGVVWGVQLLLAQGYSNVVAGQLNATLWLGSAVGAPMLAVLCDRMGSYKQPALLYMGGLALALGLFAAADASRPLWSGALLCAIGFFGGGSTILGFAYAMRLSDAGSAGTVTAFINFQLFAISGVMMALPGTLLDWGLGSSLSATLLIFPALVALTALLVALCYRDGVTPPRGEDGVDGDLAGHR